MQRGLLIVCLLILPLAMMPGQDNFDMEQVYAEEELQFGVRAFHEGAYNKAVLSFEKSLSIKPDYTLAEKWLARTYYHNGYTSTALDMWSRLKEQGQLGAASNTMLSMLQYRRSAESGIEVPPKYVEFHKLEGTGDDGTLFIRPTSVVPDRDGGFYVVAFARNEVLKFSANGTIMRTFRGGIEGLNHPFDLAINREGLFITEFSGDRIVHCRPDGRVVKRFGETGTGPGQLLGPQYITDDGRGYLYVTDQGNRRIAKFDYEGNFILSFGKETAMFGGIREPTGIQAWNDFIFVADKKKQQLIVFDESGNYIKAIDSSLLQRPEGIALYREGELIVSDESQVLLFEIGTETFFPIVIPDDATARMIHASRDANDNLLLVDFNRSIVSMQADFNRMYAGLFVQINQVNSERFPNVYADLTVQRRNGAPFVGLQQENFYITEGRYPVDGTALEYSINDSRFAEVTLLIEGSSHMRAHTDMIAQVSTQFAEELLPDGKIHVVFAADEPVLRLEDGQDAAQVRAAALSGALSDTWIFDQGLRLAASPLLDSGERRAVVYINSGGLPENAFDSYELIHLADYLQTNNIAFYSVSLDPEGAAAEETEYLCDKTGGIHVYAYNPEGVSPVVENIRSLKTGRYILSFRSNREPNFGRNYLPLEVQVSIFGRSGRGEIGYFAPPE